VRAHGFSTPTQTCARPGCDRQIKLSQFACREDWALLPSAITLAITRAYGRRRTLVQRQAPVEDLRRAQADHDAAKAAAIDWYAGHP
jgi:hypothetical protein